MLDQWHNYDINYACTSAAWTRYMATWRGGKQERWVGHGVQLPLGVSLVLSCLHLQVGEVQRRKHYSWRSCSFHFTGLHHSRTRETSNTVVILTTDLCPNVSSRQLRPLRPIGIDHWPNYTCQCWSLSLLTDKIKPILAKYKNPTFIGKV